MAIELMPNSFAFAKPETFLGDSILRTSHNVIINAQYLFHLNRIIVDTIIQNSRDPNAAVKTYGCLLGKYGRVKLLRRCLCSAQQEQINLLTREVVKLSRLNENIPNLLYLEFDRED